MVEGDPGPPVPEQAPISSPSLNGCNIMNLDPGNEGVPLDAALNKNQLLLLGKSRARQ
ncbi:hypothetical protein BDR07DRAFT_1491321 [Suillus spraguei]|nr:hypothetical protein BDR07DRAFT_1501326 [Suillus spraguei]KAG2356900.1 hypothetical protein BDR07DRAFT_1491321 [Suillus spraguei]